MNINRNSDSKFFDPNRCAGIEEGYEPAALTTPPCGPPLLLSRVDPVHTETLGWSRSNETGEFFLASAGGDEFLRVVGPDGDCKSEGEFVSLDRGDRIIVLFNALAVGPRERHAYVFEAAAEVSEEGQLILSDAVGIRSTNLPDFNRLVILYAKNGNGLRFGRLDALRPFQNASELEADSFVVAGEERYDIATVGWQMSLTLEALLPRLAQVGMPEKQFRESFQRNMRVAIERAVLASFRSLCPQWVKEEASLGKLPTVDDIISRLVASSGESRSSGEDGVDVSSTPSAP